MTEQEHSKKPWHAVYDTAVSRAAKLVSPDSLVHVPADQARSKEQWQANLNNPWSDAAALGRAVRMLRAGDIILTCTPGAFYSAARASAGSLYDHVVVVAQNGMTIHVGPPTVRLLRVERILDPKRSPLVLRPRLNRKQRKRFVALMKRYVDRRYDTVAAYGAILRLGVERATGYAQGQLLGVVRAEDDSLIPDRVICTDTTMSSLCAVSKAFRSSISRCKPPLDCVRFRGGSASLEDFLRLHRFRPDLLVRIPLPLELFSNSPPKQSGSAMLKGVLSAAGRVSGNAAIAIGSAARTTVENALQQPAAAPMARALASIGLVKLDPVPSMALVRDPVSNRSLAVPSRTVAKDSNQLGERLQDFVVMVENGVKKLSGMKGVRTWSQNGGYGRGDGGGKVEVRWSRVGTAFAMACSVLLWTKRRRILVPIFRFGLLLLIAKMTLKRKQRTIHSRL